MKIETALLSVYNKEGVVELAQRLTDMGIRILSTGGTSTVLKKAGIPVVAISEYTGSPEILDGRVKTLHPRVHGGILARHDDPGHQQTLQENDISPIALVVVNLYPFSQTIQVEGVTIAQAIEQIDIGGPTMIRAAAKNHKYATVLVDPADYTKVVEELDSHSGETSQATRRSLAGKAFHHTASYDAAIAGYFEGLDSEQEGLPAALNLSLVRKSSLRYGENPHQRAALYQPWFSPSAGLISARQHQGKELSFNNYLDLESAWNLTSEFEEPFCAIIKHTNPCGAALGSGLSDAYEKALACFGKALELYSAEGDYHAHYGWCLFLCHQDNEMMTEEAIEYVRRGAKLARDREKPYLFLGRLYKAVGRIDAAEKMFTRAVQIRPDCLDALRELRLISMRRRKRRSLLSRFFPSRDESD